MNKPLMNEKETILKITELMGEPTVEALTKRELSYELAFSEQEGFHGFEQPVQDILNNYSQNNINLNGVVTGLLTLMIDEYDQSSTASY